MNINSDGAEIDAATDMEVYGDWIRFVDGEGATVKIDPYVVKQLMDFALANKVETSETATPISNSEEDEDTIESNRRLLFASARGARIQIFVAETRIHPDDAHLQYGPISTALREMAADDSWNPSFHRVLAIAAANEFKEYFDSRQGEPDYPLFYLFLAEFLADSGM